MTVQNIPIDKILNNPYNPRTYYNRNKLDELTSSIEQVGLIEEPKARKVKNFYEIAYGGYRLRAFQGLNKKNPQKWPEMPLDVVEITDQQMAIFALEENLKRDDMTPLDTARAINRYFEIFPDTSEEDLAAKLSMSQGNISNMRRVLKCPQEVLDKVNEGKINFTMARELLVLQGLSAGTKQVWKNGKAVDVKIDDTELMLEACHSVTGKYGDATINGIKKSIFEVMRRHFPRLDKNTNSYYSPHETQFDTAAASCMKCKSMVRANETQSQVAHFCTDRQCWDKYSEAHIKKAAADAEKKMQASLAAMVIKDVKEQSPRISGVDTAETQLTAAEIKILDAAQKKDLQKAVSGEELHEEERRRQLAAMPQDYPCLNCQKIGTCDGTGVKALDSKPDEKGQTVCMYVCKLMIPASVPKEQITRQATVAIPPALLEKIKDKAGTRAEVLDIHKLGAGMWSNTLVRGYVYLSSELEHMANPEECLQSCIKGFHYAYDSSNPGKSACYVCTDNKCVAQKKAEFTRRQNARSLIKKRAETAAIKEAINRTTHIGIQEIKFVFFTSIVKRGIQGYYFPDELTWLANRLKISGKNNSTSECLKLVMAALDKLPEKEISGLLIEFWLELLRDDGDLQHYKIKTTDALNLLGVAINIPKEAKDPEKKKVRPSPGSGNAAPYENGSIEGEEEDE